MKKQTKYISLALSLAVATFFAACSDSSDDGNPAQSGEENNPQQGQEETQQTGEGDAAFNNVFTDPRDGQVYKITTIENRIWMAENMKYKYAGSSCYENSSENCAIYGRLYTHAAAAVACPEGWRLPSEFEFFSLVRTASSNGKDNSEGDAGKFLKSTSGWAEGANGVDSFGFNVLPAGYLDADDQKQYKDIGHGAEFWTSTEGTNDYWSAAIFFKQSYVVIGKKQADNELSVRCINDI